MINLRELVHESYPEHPGLELMPDVPVHGIEVDSRKVENGFLFIAVRGTKINGNDFIAEAISRGATAIVTDRPEIRAKVPVVVVPESRIASGRLASVFYGHPSRSMKVIGVTGTNGKTTTTYLLEHFLTNEGRKVGVIGTVSYRLGNEIIPAKETTPGSLQVQHFMQKMHEAGCDYVAMEVSSHALDQHRAEGVEFQSALFTNLTQDHLDYHKTLDAYFKSKAKLFLSLRKGKVAVLNADDAWAMKLSSILSCQVVTFGIEHDADFMARDVKFYPDCTQFTLESHGIKLPVSLPLVGRFNVYNALGALAIMKTLGFSSEKTVESLYHFGGVPGRLERIPNNKNISVLVDFAHTPDGLSNVLKTLSEHKRRKLIVVFGCGGDRDRGKRPKMGRIAAELADFVYVTSDNPRSEDPACIADEIAAGFPSGYRKYQVILNRTDAIRAALLSAEEEDIVLLAGKGHETVQVVGTTAIPFSDREEVMRVL